MLWTPKVHYSIHKCPSPGLSWARSIHSIPPYPTSWRSILILSFPLCLGLPSGLFPSGFPTKTLYTPLLFPIRATCPTHLILVFFLTQTKFGEEYRSLSSSLCSLVWIIIALYYSLFWKFCNNGLMTVCAGWNMWSCLSENKCGCVWHINCRLFWRSLKCSGMSSIKLIGCWILEGIFPVVPHLQTHAHA